MKVLVTGANGFIGSHLVELLCQKGFDVRCMLHVGDPGRFDVTDRKVECIRGDITNDESCRLAAHGCDTVFHLAGLSRYDARIPEADYMHVNVAGTELLLAACKDAGIRRFIYVSSIEAVGLSTDGRPLTEESEPHPRNLYGKSKLAAEKTVRDFGVKTGMECMIVRLGATYGPGERIVFERVFKPVNRGFYVLLGSGSALMEFGYVKNQVHGIHAVAEKGKPGETYFISDAQPYAFKEVVKELAHQLGVKLYLVRLPIALAWCLAAGFEVLSRVFRFPPFYVQETGRPPFSRSTLQWATKSVLYCSTAKAKQELGFTPSYSLAQGLHETVQWYRAQGWL